MKKLNYHFSRIALGAILCCFSGFTLGQTPISNAAELEAMEQYGNYVLTDDIVLTEHWDPITYESDGGHFRGTLDGDGHVIKGLRVIRGTNESSENNRQGLFRSISNATVKNLGIENAYVVGANEIGAIAGWIDRCTIEQCYVINSYIEGRDRVGAIGGRIEWVTKIKDCYAVAEINGREHQAGGIVGATGDSNGTIELVNCYFAGTVKSTYNRAGGMIGLIDGSDDVNIENCVNLAKTITGGNNPSRIVDHGSKSITLSNNYSLSATLVNNAVITTGDSEYGANKRHGANIPDGEAGTFEFYTGIGWSADVWDMLDAGYPVLKWQTTPVDVQLYGIQEGTHVLQPRGNMDLTKIGSFIGLNLTFTPDNEKITISTDGGLKATVTGEVSVPEDATIVVTAASNDYTIINNTLHVQLLPAGAIQITTASDFEYVTANPSLDFELANNIDMTEVAFAGLCSEGAPFTGTLDGKGFVIEGLKFENTGTSAMGLFRATQNATIKNLGLEKVHFVGANDIGGIVGIMKGGKIEQSYVANDSYIEAGDRAAGIAARVSDGAEIENCYVEAIIKARDHQLGGIAAASFEDGVSIINNYFSGELQGGGNGGAMLGLIDRDGTVTIQNCLNLATSVSGRDPYRICSWGGRESHTNFSNNYSINTTLVGGNIINDGTATNRHGANLPDDDDAKSSTFYTETLNWDFTTVWTFVSGKDYPVLRVFPASITSSSVVSNPEYRIVSSNDRISLSGLSENARISIFNINGQKILVDAKANTEAQYSLPAKGFYMVTIEENNRTSVIKIVNR
jgi:hypothetical protein